MDIIASALSTVVRRASWVLPVYLLGSLFTCYAIYAMAFYCQQIEKVMNILGLWGVYIVGVACLTLLILFFDYLKKGKTK
jgi:hypothetical protein